MTPSEPVAGAGREARAPSAWQIERVMSAVQQALAALRDASPSETDEADGMELLASPILAGHELDISNIMRRLLLAATEAKSNAEAVNGRMEALAARKARFVRQSDAWREAALQIIVTLPELFPGGKYKDALVSASVRHGKPGVLVTDIDKLEDRFVRVKREPDKTAIATAFADGEVVTGAEQSNARDFITIRTT